MQTELLNDASADDPDSQPITLPVIPAVPPKANLNTLAERAYRTAETIVIDSPDMYAIAADELQSLQGKLAHLDEQRFSITRPMDAAKKAVMDLFRTPTERCTAGIELLKRKMHAYTVEQRRIADAQRAEAERLAREERARQEEIARQQREAAEAAAREAEEARRKAAQAAEVGDESGAAEAQQQVTQAEQIAQQAQQSAAVASHVASVITAPAIPVELPKAAGISTTTRYKAEVVDKMALIKFVAENPQYLEVLDANMPALNRLATSLKTNMQINGVKVVPVESITSRRR